MRAQAPGSPGLAQAAGRVATRGPGLVLACTLGDCVHVAGARHFLALAEDQGWETRFLGASLPVSAVVESIARDRSDPNRPTVVGLSYRLSPGPLTSYLAELATALLDRGLLQPWADRPVLVFGGTPSTCRVAESSGLFRRVFPSGTTEEETRAYLWEAAGGRSATAPRGRDAAGSPVPADPPGTRLPFGQTLAERVRASAPWPLFRHHFGLPSLAATINGCSELAASGLVDVISLGPDQNTQERFFHPEEIDERSAGAGGVPIRTPEHFLRLQAAAQTGNFPLLRCYSGTRDVLAMAEVLRETIDNAWCAVPLFWYSVLDARSDRPVRAAIAENQQVMAWHGQQGIPVEVNESHHWSLREAPDAVAVAAAFLAAYNAKRRGVGLYVSQYMFNTPPGTWPEMDLGKMLAKIELIESLHDDQFTTLRQVRTGLASFPADPDEAKGHLAAATWLQMALRPDIVHVVAYCEADHLAFPREILESVKICRQVVREALAGHSTAGYPAAAIARQRELVSEATALLGAIAGLAAPGVADPWTDVETLARAVEVGLLDAPHLAGNPAASGRVRTRVVDGKCVAVDPITGRVLPEAERIERVLGRAPSAGAGEAGEKTPVLAATGR